MSDLSSNQRCNNWPCAKDAGHDGPCSSSRDDRSSNERARPERDQYPLDMAGDLRFTRALCAWQYGEIERLQQDVARYENGRLVLMSENERLRRAKDAAVELWNQCGKDLAAADLRVTPPPKDVQRDAARWRWIRGNDGETAMNPRIQEMWAKTSGRYPSPEEWDAAIDAAIASSTKEPSRKYLSTEPEFNLCDNQGVPRCRQYPNCFCKDTDRAKREQPDETSAPVECYHCGPREMAEGTCRCIRQKYQR